MKPALWLFAAIALAVNTVPAEARPHRRGGCCPAKPVIVIAPVAQVPGWTYDVNYPGYAWSIRLKRWFAIGGMVPSAPTAKTTVPGCECCDGAECICDEDCDCCSGRSQLEPTAQATCRRGPRATRTDRPERRFPRLYRLLHPFQR